MIEKILLGCVLSLVSALGYLAKEMLSEIKATQKEHSTSLRVLRENITVLESKQATTNYTIQKVQESVTSVAQLQREAKSIFDHNLYEMRQQMKEYSEKQSKQKQNFGKIIFIVQKLYEAIGRVPKQ